MNQKELYATLIVIPALSMMVLFIIGLAVAVLTGSDELLERIFKALERILIIVVLYEIALIIYVLMIN